MSTGGGDVDQDLMRKLEKIEQRQIRAEERGDAFQKRLLDVLEDIRDRFLVPVAAPPPPPVNQSELIRWLAAAVVLASLGSKVLELLPTLWGKG